MIKNNLNTRIELQRELKKLTLLPNWLSNERKKLRVHELRTELFPKSFPKK